MKKSFRWIGAVALFTQMALLSATTPSANSSTDGASVGNAEEFQGINLSAGVGYNGLKLITQRSGIKPKANTTYGSDGVAVQLKVAGDYAFMDMGLVGIEAYGQYNSGETENNFYETTTSTTATNRTFKMSWNLGLDLKLGIAPRPSNLIFIYGGPDWGHYNFHYKTTGVDNTYSEFHLGGMLGAGLQQFFCDQWFIKTTFDYRWYPSKTLTYSNGETQSIKPRLGTALFMVGYNF
ncbi:MAG: porin family protein [Simkaniaceae bacterium]|nr:porin family protein [Simkaniaceae bacterium]MCF7852591.1 porin family protein [Simkaniaceae bacterium]